MDKKQAIKEPNVNNSKNPAGRQLPETAYHKEQKPKNK